MISAILSDAVDRIRKCQKDRPEVFGSIAAKVNPVVKAMEDLVLELELPTKVIIAISTEHKHTTCGFCSAEFGVEQGSALFREDSRQSVCRQCAEIAAPEIHAVYMLHRQQVQQQAT